MAMEAAKRSNESSIDDALWMLENVYIPRAILGGEGVTIVWEGPPGHGKTQRALQFARKMQRNPGRAIVEAIRKMMPILGLKKQPVFGAAFHNVASWEAVDWRGWPAPVGADGRSRMGEPGWLQPGLPDLQMRDEKGDILPFGLIMIDEPFQVADETSVLPMAQFSAESRVGEHALPAGWCKLLMSNRHEDHSCTVDLPGHIRGGRIVRVQVRMTMEEHVRWMEENGSLDIFRHWAVYESKHGRDTIYNSAVPTGNENYPCPRSLSWAHDDVAMYLQAVGVDLEQDSLPVDVEPHGSRIMGMIAGRMGESSALRAMEFFTVLKNQPMFEEIVADPTGVDIPTHPGLIYAVGESLAKHVTEETAEAVATYAIRMPKNIGALVANKMVSKLGRSLANKPAVGKLAQHCAVTLQFYAGQKNL